MVTPHASGFLSAWRTLILSCVTSLGVLLPATLDGAQEDPVQPWITSLDTVAWQLRADDAQDLHQDTVVSRLRIAGGTITISLDHPEIALDRPAIHAWVRTAAQALVGFYGHYPVPAVRIEIAVGGEAGVHHGVTYGGRLIQLALGADTSSDDLHKDWILTHEMFHLAFPDLPASQVWLEEGLATYLEPLARARIHALPVDEVWRQLIVGLPQGLPGPGDQGLDHTHTWGRTYWGGCLYCLLADLTIRDATAGAHRLDDALTAVLAAGGDGSQHWELARVLRLGAQATTTSVLEDLYRSQGAQPVSVDLDGLWRKLGITCEGPQLRYDQHSPWAGLRRDLTAAVAVTAPVALPH